MTGLETIALAGLVGSTGLSALGAIQQGYATRDQMEYNATVADQNAAAARSAAALDEDTSRKKSSRILGTIRARAAASGVELGGSPLDVLADSASEAELEALTIRYRGETEARRQESEARLARARGKSAVSQGWIGAGAQLLQGAASAYKIYQPVGGASSGGIPDLSPTSSKYRPWGDK